MNVASPLKSPIGAACLLAAGLVSIQLQAASTSSDLNKTFSVDPGGTLAMEVDRGSITVATGDRTDVAIEVKRTISGLSDSKAQAVFDDHEVTFTQDKDRVLIKARFKSPTKGWFSRDQNKLQVKYLISIPKKFNVDLNTAGGSITLGDLDGVAKVRTSGGSLNLAEVTGKVDAHTAGGNVTLKNGGDEATLKTSGGSIHVGKAAGDTLATTAGGSISVDTAEKKLTARTSGGSISLGAVKGETEADTAGGSITVKSAAAKLTAKTSGGSIHIDDAHGPVSANTAAGSVTVTFSEQPAEACRLSSSGGDITVRLAESLAFDVDASTAGGSIRSDIPVTSKLTGEQRSGTLKGTINGGGQSLVLRTSAGKVTIAKIDK